MGSAGIVMGPRGCDASAVGAAGKTKGKKGGKKEEQGAALHLVPCSKGDVFTHKVRDRMNLSSMCSVVCVVCVLSVDK